MNLSLIDLPLFPTESCPSNSILTVLQSDDLRLLRSGGLLAWTTTPWSCMAGYWLCQYFIYKQTNNKPIYLCLRRPYFLIDAIVWHMEFVYGYCQGYGVLSDNWNQSTVQLGETRWRSGASSCKEAGPGGLFQTQPERRPASASLAHLRPNAWVWTLRGRHAALAFPAYAAACSLAGSTRRRRDSHCWPIAADLSPTLSAAFSVCNQPLLFNTPGRLTLLDKCRQRVHQLTGGPRGKRPSQVWDHNVFRLGRSECLGYPVNTKHLYNIYSMLDKRRRRWADVDQNIYFSKTWFS